VLRCAEMHVTPPLLLQEMVEVNRRVTFPHGVGLPGRVWSTGRAAWIADVVHEPNFPRTAAAAKDGVHGAFGFPIIGPRGFLGVMEFYSGSAAAGTPARALHGGDASGAPSAFPALSGV